MSALGPTHRLSVSLDALNSTASSLAPATPSANSAVSRPAPGAMPARTVVTVVLNECFPYV